ncbi:hypothetical protein DFH28DRAFT_1141148 [Melampsora americana]|nr:hypothetical protein DFH28DRAFT_1141148 [Melampsora americana]
MESKYSSGRSALVIRNGLKAGGRLTGPCLLLTGLGAGMVKAIIAVTPSETIKTKLINESMQPNPWFSGLIQGT